MKGLFSLAVWSQKQPLSLVRQCRSCGLDKQCSSPYMKVSGQGLRKILIVAEAPGKDEDRKGAALVGNSGIHLSNLMEAVKVRMRKDCWLTNTVVCRPQHTEKTARRAGFGARAGDNRTPTHDEINFCRPGVAKDIYELQPDVIVLLGESAIRCVIPLAWREEKNYAVKRWAGWVIPSIKLNAWIVPTYHPAALLHDPSPACNLHVLRHLRAASELEGKPWKTRPDYASRVNVIFDHHKAAQSIRDMMRMGRPMAFDYETTCLKPDGPHARILCCSVSDGRYAVAYPWYGEAIQATQDFLRSDIPKIAANLRFEERWTRKVFGHGVNKWLHDTVVGAHWRNCQTGICGLKFQAFVRFGMEDYSSHLDALMGDGDSNAPNRLHEVEPAILLKYCGLDSLLEVMVAQDQRIYSHA